MILQNIIWPKKGVCTEEKLYFHANVIDEDFNIDRDENHKKSNMNYVNYQRISEIKGGGLKLDRFGKVAFDTYFNGLSIEKWEEIYYCQSGNSNSRDRRTFSYNIMQQDISSWRSYKKRTCKRRI